MIKVISFDIGGTIILNEEMSNYNLNKLAEITKQDYNKVRNAYKDVFQKTKATLYSLETSFCNKLKITLTEEIDNFFKNKFLVSPKIKINEDFLEVITYLKKKGYRIILFSNSCCLINNDLPKEIEEKIDYIFYSYDIGYTKSDEESYRIIEKKLNCNSDEILHIGDTLSSDYLKPKSFGWHAIYYGESNDKVVNSINSMKKILEKV